MSEDVPDSSKMAAPMKMITQGPAHHIEGNRCKCSTNGGNYVGKLMTHNFRVICCSGIIIKLYSILTMKNHNTMKQPDFYHY
jgi:hypothetical protein